MTHELKLDEETQSKLIIHLDNLNDEAKTPWLLKPSSIVAIIGLLFGAFQWSDKTAEIKRINHQLTLKETRYADLNIRESLLYERLRKADDDLKLANDKFNDLATKNEDVMRKISTVKKAIITAKIAERTAIDAKNNSIEELNSSTNNILTAMNKIWKLDEKRRDLEEKHKREKKALEKDKKELEITKNKLGVIGTYINDEKLSNHAILELISPRVMSIDRGCIFCLKKYKIKMFLDYPDAYKIKLSENDRISNVNYIGSFYKGENELKSLVLSGGSIAVLPYDTHNNRWVGVYKGDNPPAIFKAEITLKSTKDEPGGCYIISYPKKTNIEKYQHC
jgi:hypothetical protein